MRGNARKSAHFGAGLVYEVRALSDRWADPLAGATISRHGSAEAALAARERQPRAATDGSGRTGRGDYVATVVVEIDGQGNERVTLPVPTGGHGLLASLAPL